MRFENLGELRRKLVGYSKPALVHLSGFTEARIDELEAGVAPSVYELDVLGRLYGVDPDCLEDSPIEIPPDDGVRVLALLDEFQEVPAELKVRIIEASNAARDLVELRTLDGEAHPWEQFEQIRPLGAPNPNFLPHEQGRDYAGRVRARYHLGRDAIPSVRDWLSEAFPQVAVLYANLGTRIAGVTFADARRGAVIVVNLEGKNQNPCVRRFSLLHELSHVLVDSDRHEPLASLSGFLNETGLDRERRANAFAMRLLCPEQEARRIFERSGRDEHRTASVLIGRYGVHYAAVRLYLRNLTLGQLPQHPPETLIALATSPWWEDAEEPIGLKNFPLEEAPPERRTLVARYAARLYSRGVIHRDQFARLMGVTPAHEVERVLAYFELDPPLDA